LRDEVADRVIGVRPFPQVRVVQARLPAEAVVFKLEDISMVVGDVCEFATGTILVDWITLLI